MFIQVVQNGKILENRNYFVQKAKRKQKKPCILGQKNQTIYKRLKKMEKKEFQKDPVTGDLPDRGVKNDSQKRNNKIRKMVKVGISTRTLRIRTLLSNLLCCRNS